MSRPSKRDRARTSARPGAAPPARSSSCRSPTRRRARRISPRSTAEGDAVDGVHPLLRAPQRRPDQAAGDRVARRRGPRPRAAGRPRSSSVRDAPQPRRSGGRRRRAPVPTVRRSGRSVRTALEGAVAARPERAADDRLVEPRRRAGDRRRQRRRRAGRAWPRRAGACTGAAVSWKSASIEPCSTISPAYMTAARSQIWATTGRSCVTSMSARPRSSAERVEQLEDLRLHHHVERRRRLVGEQDASACRRAPSRSRRAAACRPRTRAGSGRPGRRECRRSSSSSPVRAGRRVPAAHAVQLHRLDDLRADRLDRVEARSSRPGRPSRCRSSGAGASISSPPARMSSPSSRTRPATRRVRRQEAHEREDRRRLAAARLADEPEPLARARARS